MKIQVPWDMPLVFLRPNRLIPFQDAISNTTINNTRMLMEAPTHVYANPGQGKGACGVFYFDNGLNSDYTAWIINLNMTFSTSATIDVSVVQKGTYKGADMILGNVKVYRASTLTTSSASCTATYTASGKTETTTAAGTYDATTDTFLCPFASGSTKITYDQLVKITF